MRARLPPSFVAAGSRWRPRPCTRRAPTQVHHEQVDITQASPASPPQGRSRSSPCSAVAAAVKRLTKDSRVLCSPASSCSRSSGEARHVAWPRSTSVTLGGPCVAGGPAASGQLLGTRVLQEQGQCSP